MEHITDGREADAGCEQPSTLIGTAQEGAHVRPEIAASRDVGERLFVEHLSLIQRLTGSVARQYHLSTDEAEEFTATVHLRLIADHYAVLHKFRRQCSLQTYLTVVIQRMCLDFRDARWGKWRVSAATQRRGEVAIRLERLTMRDGLTFDEACAVLEINYGATLERDTLARIYSQFRVRTRARFVSDEELPDLQAPGDAPDRPIVETEQTAALSRAISALADEMQKMSPRDRLLLQLRFADGLAVAAVARLLRVNQKGLYRRYVQLFKRLRRYLESHGVARQQIVPLLGETVADTAGVFAPNGRATDQSGLRETED